MEELIKILHETGCSCVIRNGGPVRTFTRRGVADLYALLCDEPAFLQGASVADKVVGKGAAALMALGGVGELYADVVSLPALALLQAAGIRTAYGVTVPAIRNRDGSGLCPLEQLCAASDDPQELLPLIAGFVKERQR